MALYTHLTKKDISRVTARFGLPPPRKIKGILQGTVNTYYQLTYPEETYFLKIDEVGKRSRLQKELRILSHLAAKQKRIGFETPRPLKNKKGGYFVKVGKKFVLLFPKIGGKAQTLAGLNPKKLRPVGKALAHLHRVSDKARFSPHRFHLPEIKRVYRQIQKKLQKKHPAVDLEIGQWIGWLSANRPRNLPCGLIHADLFPENILFAGNKLTGIVDFEAAGRGPFLFDLATTLHACCHTKNGFSSPRVKTFLKGYQRVRKLTAREKSLLEYFLFESALRFLLTRLRDFELKEGPVKAKPFKDYREFLRRFAEIPGLTENLLSNRFIHQKVGSSLSQGLRGRP